jgi:DHA1 family purine ribonucleoside efflux pump-like MFS transporter
VFDRAGASGVFVGAGAVLLVAAAMIFVSLRDRSESGVAVTSEA